jgi:hypothetical protein
VEEVVALSAGNLEAHETVAFSRDNGLLTFAADNNRFEFHSAPLALLALLCGEIPIRNASDLPRYLLTCRPPVSLAREEQFNHPALRMREFAARGERPGPY